MLSFSVHSLSSRFSCLISSFSSFIVFIVLHSLVFFSFYYLQFLSNLAQYFLLYLLSDQLDSFFYYKLPQQFLSSKCSFFSFLSFDIFYISLIFFLKFFNCFLCILQIFLFFPSIGFSYKLFPLYQVFIFLFYLSLVQNSLDFLFFFSLNYD